MLLFIEGFQPQNVFIFFFLLMNHSNALVQKNYFEHWSFSLIEDIGDIRYFNATLDIITKEDFEGVQVILLQGNF